MSGPQFIPTASVIKMRVSVVVYNVRRSTFSNKCLSSSKNGSVAGSTFYLKKSNFDQRNFPAIAILTYSLANIVAGRNGLFRPLRLSKKHSRLTRPSNKSYECFACGRRTVCNILLLTANIGPDMCVQASEWSSLTQIFFRKSHSVKYMFIITERRDFHPPTTKTCPMQGNQCQQTK